MIHVCMQKMVKIGASVAHIDKECVKQSVREFGRMAMIGIAEQDDHDHDYHDALLASQES